MKFNNLNKLRVGGTDSKMQLAIRPPSTPSGRIYRMSPNPDAHPRHFVIGNVVADFEVSDDARKRMKLEPRSKNTICPYSGTVAPNHDFLHPDDKDAAIAIVGEAAVADAREALANMLKGIAAKNPKHFTYKPGSPSRPKLRFSREDLLRELVCDHCGRDYGVYAIALFCPDCGAPNLRLHFERERQLVNGQVEIAEAQEDELAELAYRLLGNAHEDVLTAFEATLKTVYLFGIANRPAGAPAVKPVGNDFQNIEKADRRFKDLALDPFQHLTGQELAILKLNIQKRHIIGHNLGVVDAKFAEHAADARLGETVKLVAQDVRQFATLCQKVVDHLDTWLCGAPSPTLAAAEAVEESPSSTAKPARKTTSDDIDLDISPLAKEIGVWLANQSANGLRYLQAGSDLAGAFPAHMPRDLAKAIAELEQEGLATASGGIGRAVPFPSPTVELFAVFDPVVTGFDPHLDACQLVKSILEHGKTENASSYSISSPELFQETGWSLRRFNPALSIIIAHLDDRRVVKSSDGEFAARAFIVTVADELTLEAFLKRMGD